MDGTIKNDVYSLIEYDYDGIIGVEAATSYWGLSTFNPAIPIFLFNDDNAEENGLFVESSLSVLFVPNVNMDNLVELSEHLRITDPEQTVCDMVRYNRHEFHLFETLISAYSGMVNIEKLESLANYYNISDKMQKLYKEALEVEEEG
jgi:hypothetical protein